jgi:hypothetical protein
VLAIAALPFAVKAELVIIARIWKTNLRPTLPWLHTLRWTLWLIGMPFVLLAVLRSSRVNFSLLRIRHGSDQQFHWLWNC